jgi:hypothetical protein
MVRSEHKNVFDQLDAAKNGLIALRKNVSRKRARTIDEALDLFDYFELLQDSVDDLWDELADNHTSHKKNLARSPDDKGRWDLLAAVFAVDTVIDFLRSSPSNSLSLTDRRQRSKSLGQLRQALIELSEGGVPAPMLRSQGKNGGRRADVSLVLSMKGALAGFMYRQQHAGMSRSQAAKWIADNMSPKLAARISRKPITARMVEEWLDRFGGKHAEEGAGRKALALPLARVL